MSEQNINAHAQFEKSINKLLTGDTRQNALSFMQHMVSMGMAPEGSANDGKFTYKGKNVCYTHLSGNYSGYPGPWTIWTEGNYSKEIENIQIDDHMKEIAWANVHNCDSCGSTRCGPDKRKVIFGRAFDNVCHSAMAFTGPDAETVECTKKLMEMRKHAIEAGE